MAQSRARKERTKALKIDTDTYNRVYERDNGICCLCIMLGTHPKITSNAIIECHHFIPRSRSGMGIEENLVLLCKYHHQEETRHRDKIEEYLKSKYENWDKERLVWKKYD